MTLNVWYMMSATSSRLIDGKDRTWTKSDVDRLDKRADAMLVERFRVTVSDTGFGSACTETWETYRFEESEQRRTSFGETVA